MCANATPQDLIHVIASVLTDSALSGAPTVPSWDEGDHSPLAEALGATVTLTSAGGSLVIAIAPCDAPGMTPHQGGTFTLTVA